MDTGKVFKSGNSQAIRLPKEYRFAGAKVYLKKVGNTVILIPEEGSWESLFKSLEMFSDDFMTNREQPVQQKRESPFE